MIQRKVNGVEHAFDGDPEMPLLWYLRDQLQVTGTKYGCGVGLCGACTVHVDGAATRSCLTVMGGVVGKAIVTIEGLSPQGDHPVQQAWKAGNVPQCGYCQSGQIMQAVALLQDKPKPTDQNIDAAMQGNICRCGTYQRIRQAIKLAAAAEGAESLWYPSVYLGIEPTGTVIIMAHRSEMGTGIRTALPMVLADALDADWTRVKIEQALGDPKYGDQNTDGSKSIRDFYDALREAGASARLMLERAAAAQWGVPASTCRAQQHQVVHAASGRSVCYGALATLAAQQPVPQKAELRFKAPAEFRYIGKGVPIVDGTPQEAAPIRYGTHLMGRILGYGGTPCLQ